MYMHIHIYIYIYIYIYIHTHTAVTLQTSRMDVAGVRAPRRCFLEHRYTRSPLEDSRLFGPSPWKILATTYEQMGS